MCVHILSQNFDFLHWYFDAICRKRERSTLVGHPEKAPMSYRPMVYAKQKYENNELQFLPTPISISKLCPFQLFRPFPAAFFGYYNFINEAQESCLQVPLCFFGEKC